MISLSAPNLAGNEWRYVKECLDTGWISSAGEYVSRFESNIADYTGAKHAIACVNGSAGLHVALQLSGVKRGDYVIAPNLTFVATVNAIRYCGAEPILIDIDPETWQLDLSVLEEFLEGHTESRGRGRVLKSDERPISGILPVHVLGNICELTSLQRLCSSFSIAMIEDACEALGSRYRDQHAGTIGDIGVLSFNGNKIISTGGGGMILTSNDEIAARAVHLTTQAKTSAQEYDHDEVGYNYRLVNVLAAIGVAQLENLPTVLENNKRRDAFYRSELGRFEEFKFQYVAEHTDPNCWLFTLRSRNMRKLLAHLQSNGVQARPFWRPMNQLPMFENCQYYSHNDIARSVYDDAISIPSSSNITDSQLERVVETISGFMGRTTSCNTAQLAKPRVEPELKPEWKVQLFELNYDDAEARAVQQVINGRWITMGSQTKMFESAFAEFLQSRVICKAVSSCTAALHLALMALEIGAGDEVIVPALTFVADANVVRVVGATPVPADCGALDYWNVTADSIERRITSKTKAVMIVHYAGYSCDMDPIVGLCRKHNLPLIEDVAHAPGASYKGRACGTFGDFACFSFFTNKNMSIGEGGMIATASESLAEKIGYIRSQGMTSQTLDRHLGRINTYDVALPGLNYRMDEMHASIGLVQLNKLQAGNSKRKALVEYYDFLLANLPTIKIPFADDVGSTAAYHIYPVLLPARVDRANVIRTMQADLIQTSIHYQSFRDFSAYAKAHLPPTPVADEVSRRVLTLPLFPTMTEHQIELVVSSLKGALIT